jgi:DNA polymerase IV
MKIHLDIDCYFVSAERSRYSFLKDKCVVVAKGSDKKIFSRAKKEWISLSKCGAFNGVLESKNSYSQDILGAWREEFIDDDGSIHGIVIAKSYETKKFGIKTGTPLSQALHMCKDLIVLPSDHLFYQEFSHRLREFLELKIPLLEQYSIDEFFGDLDGWIDDKDTLAFITNLRNEIQERFHIPVSIGASKSKWIAKLLTDHIKPYGVYVLESSEIQEYTKDIPIDDFPGIGRAISTALKKQMIFTLGELRDSNYLLRYGKAGKDLYARICGDDGESIITSRERKAISISRNFTAISNRDELKRRVHILARYLSHNIAKLQLNPATFYLKIRYEYGIKKYESITIHRLFSEKLFLDTMRDMFQNLDSHKEQKIHYIAMSASNFDATQSPKTLNLLEYDNDRRFAELNQKLLKIRDRYGVDAIRYGCE